MYDDQRLKRNNHGKGIYYYKHKKIKYDGDFIKWILNVNDLFKDKGRYKLKMEDII